MFVTAIEEISKFTRPIHTIMRHYPNDFIEPGAATLFFVNDDGVAITCKHVLNVLAQEKLINDHFSAFKSERSALGSKHDGKYKKKLKELELKYKFTQPNPPYSIVVAQLKNTLVDCFDKIQIDFIPHPTLDLAILKFRDYTQKFYSSHAIFIKDSSQLKQGRTLCRFGFPFVEFNNFQYDAVNDEINFTDTGNKGTPPFAIDGIITRQVTDGKQLVALELSTPGLRGQSGCALFDTNGLVCGLQSVTNYYHLGFNEKKYDIVTNGKKSSIYNDTFFNVGRCVHVDRIKDFLTEHSIKFHEA